MDEIIITVLPFASTDRLNNDCNHQPLQIMLFSSRSLLVGIFTPKLAAKEGFKTLKTHKL